METVYIVSGLPRSGTSMMMDIIRAGGIEPYYDVDRVPNEFNPNGFYETTKVSNIYLDNSFISECVNKCVKIASNSLTWITPNAYNYKVIFMRRDINEIIQSRIKIYKKRGSKEANEPLGWHLYVHKDALNKSLDFLKENNIDYIEINYNDLILNPKLEIEKLIKFINLPLDYNKMILVPDEKLYRNRIKTI